MVPLYVWILQVIYELVRCNCFKHKHFLKLQFGQKPRDNLDRRPTDVAH